MSTWTSPGTSPGPGELKNSAVALAFLDASTATASANATERGLSMAEIIPRLPRPPKPRRRSPPRQRRARQRRRTRAQEGGARSIRIRYGLRLSYRRELPDATAPQMIAVLRDQRLEGPDYLSCEA